MSGGRVRMPADVNRPDTLLGPFTARQLALLAAASTLLYGGWALAGSWLPPVVFLAAAAVVLTALGAGLLTRIGGLPAVDWARAAARYATAPRRRVPAGTGLPRGLGRWPAQLRAVTDAGVLIYPDGRRARLVEVTGGSFRLRSAEEQQGLVAAFGQWLNSLPGPVHLHLATAADTLTSRAAALRQHAAALPHPRLETVALAHAAHLEQLTATGAVRRRRVLLTIPATPAEGDDRPARGESAAGWDGEPGLAGLTAAGLTVRLLGRGDVLAVLAAAAAEPAPAAGALLANPGEPITTNRAGSWPDRLAAAEQEEL